MVLKYQNILKVFSKYPNQLKQADILLPHKTSESFLRKVKDLWVFFQMLIRFIKGASTIKYQPVLNISFLYISAVFARVIAHNTVC